MKIECILIATFSLIAFANAHGQLKDPLARSGLAVNQYSAGYQNMFYYRDGSPHICGNNGYDEIENTQLTGNVTKTYTSGTNVTMKVYFQSAHQGFFRLKLCKLSSASAIVSEDCFNQELLKIKSEVPTFIMRGKTKEFYIDDYTIRVGPSNPSSGEISLDVSLTVELPVGLTCENCVLLFDYRHNAIKSTDLNGVTFGITDDIFVPEYDGPVGIYQTFRTCSDIKIVSNPDQASSVYKPNPVKPKKRYPSRLFSCDIFSSIFNFDDMFDVSKQGKKSSDVKISQYPNMRPDLNKFTGEGVFCLVDSDQGMDACSVCQQNCQTPDKQCPSFCFCRWYPSNPIPYLTPVKKGQWQF